MVRASLHHKNTSLVLQTWLKNYDWGGLKLSGRFYIVILLNVHAFKLSSKYLCLYPQTGVDLSLHEWVVANMDTQLVNALWKRMMGDSVPPKIIISHILGPKVFPGKGGRNKVREKDKLLWSSVFYVWHDSCHH